MTKQVIKCFDVACYILEKFEPMSALKLQKLVYYCQAWSLVWDGRPLFAERIEAWANGPVVPELYNFHRGNFEVTRGNFSECSVKDLDEDGKETIDAVLKYYGDKSPHWLIAQTHAESPWLDARKGCQPGDRCQKEITHAAMAEYYSEFT